jgi:hypothetical protein
MSKATVSLSVSLDGFAAALQQSLENYVVLERHVSGGAAAR